MASKEDTRLSFFDIMSAINAKTKVEWSDEVEAAYNSFMINRGYSNFADSVLFANELNQYPDLDKKLQFDFYYYYLPKGKRFGKWEKALSKSNDQELVMEYFGISRDKTESYIQVLNSVEPDWQKKIKEQLEKGGRKK